VFFLDLRTFKIVYIVHWIYLWFYFVRILVLGHVWMSFCLKINDLICYLNKSLACFFFLLSDKLIQI
jgi:hypothetical protein